MHFCDKYNKAVSFLWLLISDWLGCDDDFPMDAVLQKAFCSLNNSPFPPLLILKFSVLLLYYSRFPSMDSKPDHSCVWIHRKVKSPPHPNFHLPWLVKTEPGTGLCFPHSEKERVLNVQSPWCHPPQLNKKGSGSGAVVLRFHTELSCFHSNLIARFKRQGRMRGLHCSLPPMVFTKGEDLMLPGGNCCLPQVTQLIA